MIENIRSCLCTEEKKGKFEDTEDRWDHDLSKKGICLLVLS